MSALFAYGTLEIPEVLEAVTGRRFASAPALLEGYTRSMLRGHLYPGVVEAAGGRTPGRVYFGLDPGSVALLDRFEDDCYERRRVAVRALQRGEVGAFTYAIPVARRGLLEARPWRRERFAEHLEAYLAGCRAFRAEQARALHRAGMYDPPGGTR